MAAATRLASASACSSDTPGLRRAYAKYCRLPRFASDGDGTKRNPHLGVAACFPQARERKLERWRHDAADRVLALVERDGAADDLAPAAEAAPQGARDDGARVVGEPLAEERWTELPRERRRHRRAGDELRLARRRQAGIGRRGTSRRRRSSWSAARSPAARAPTSPSSCPGRSCSRRTATRSARRPGTAAAAAARR